MNETREKRGVFARLGLAMLSFVVPGLGLIRTGRWKLGFAFTGLYIVFIFALLAYFAFGPMLSFSTAAVMVIVGFFVVILCQIVSPILTFIVGKRFEIRQPWWTRWYAIVGCIILWFGFQEVATANLRSHYRPFYVPAESMKPNLLVNDRFFAKMSDFDPLKRGDVILFNASGAEYVKRIAALPGDQVELVAGHLKINGVPVKLQSAGDATRQMVCDSSYGLENENLALLNLEILPGEFGGHLSADCGTTLSDDFPPTVVPSDHYFVLGDNRDFSADSRYAPPVGVGMVSKQDVIGKPLFIHWSDERKRIGKSVN
ncbi:signal peptidase I [Parasphingorhabdus sp.]|uniref:signal peptidase I n=1 Tax=Parasphingorhabdus sp. TaxID=2709688 RepID=UPI003A93706B